MSVGLPDNWAWIDETRAHGLVSNVRYELCVGRGALPSYRLAHIGGRTPTGQVFTFKTQKLVGMYITVEAALWAAEFHSGEISRTKGD